MRKYQGDEALPHFTSIAVMGLLVLSVMVACAFGAAREGFFDGAPPARMHVLAAEMRAGPGDDLSASRPVAEAAPGVDLTETAAIDDHVASVPACDLQACGRAYRSFRSEDCTYQPYDAPRRLCTR